MRGKEVNRWGSRCAAAALAGAMLLGLLPTLSDAPGWMRWGMQLAVTVGCCAVC